MELSYSKYSLGVIREYADRLTFYLTNYDNVDTSLKKDVVKIYGSSSKPGYSNTDRAKHTASKVTEDWSNGVFTLTVTHNGPLDITINCSGNATGRETVYRAATVTVRSRHKYMRGNFSMKQSISIIRILPGYIKTLLLRQSIIILLWATSNLVPTLLQQSEIEFVF